jgi:hypothetical protein
MTASRNLNPRGLLSINLTARKPLWIKGFLGADEACVGTEEAPHVSVSGNRRTHLAGVVTISSVNASGPDTGHNG